MKYDFTTRLSRKEMGAVKWEKMYECNPNVAEDVVPLSVADMELKNPPEVIEGLKDFLDETVLGYTGAYPAFEDAVVNWQKKRHQWDIQKEWIVHTQGVVAAFYAAIRAFTEKGDGVILFRPVYYPFGMAIEDNNRTEVNVPLRNENGSYTIDFEAFEEAAAKPENKMLIFCSPHNPVGRVWKKEELERLAEIAVKHNIFIVSDEIWYDFTMPEHPHTVMATVNEALNKQLIVCTSPSKTFNLAGMVISNIIIPNKNVREEFTKEILSVRGDMIGILGFKACELAYTQSEAWLDELLLLIQKNQQLVTTYFEEHFPQIKTYPSEGTFLQWVNFEALGMSNEEMEHFLQIEAEFFTDGGYIFGEEGKGYERINLALPTDCLHLQLKKLGTALHKKGF
ncbi:pyridoxal phosphate-dependent aminotransferase [Jeotgalibaca sp. MA1X17-3]|uniref:MalY/PatB family protein n=1 Tax=Jeotgalibaca sp. MA1X17-3 TaxID=2908211 RepID=UPI001F36F9EB|nr:MalY/PatB family protein [Jeotgalibaca sp. MA1X17-3]UJF16111.1 pyridoxal phosphate-dependent aminotransferase [Jeotgalibaca sp. MA1X17-3]